MSVIVNRPPVTGLLSLCVTSQSLDPNGTCLNVGSLPPSLSTGSLVSGGTAGAITSTGGVFGPAIFFQYVGQITLGGRTFHGDARGWAKVFPSLAAAVPPFLLTNAVSSDTLSATCSGQWRSTTPGGFGVGAAVSVLTCTGSVNGGPPGTTTLRAVYAVTSSSSRPFDDEVGYSGVFAGV